jgi:hypothetical protein
MSWLLTAQSGTVITAAQLLGEEESDGDSMEARMKAGNRRVEELLKKRDRAAKLAKKAKPSQPTAPRQMDLLEGD